ICRRHVDDVAAGGARRLRARHRRSSSVRDFLYGAPPGLGFDIEWTGNGIDARAVDRRSGRIVVAVDAKLYRPAEVDVLIGDARKAQAALGWGGNTRPRRLA